MMVLYRTPSSQELPQGFHRLLEARLARGDDLLRRLNVLRARERER